MEGSPGHSILRDLLQTKGLVPEGEAKAETNAGKVPGSFRVPLVDLASVERLVLQFERKGHGGKRVTRVEGFSSRTEGLDELARRLQREMGCGAWLEDEAILLQGDLTDRLKDWFLEKGVKRVVISGRGGTPR